jgi:transposase
MEVSPPQPKVEADPIHFVETQTSQEEASTRKRKREMVSPKSPIEGKRRSKWIRRHEDEEIQDTTEQPEEIQDTTEQPL